MTLKQFEDTINELQNGYEKYNNLVNSLECLLDSASLKLNEKEYSDFKEILKDRLLEDLWRNYFY